MSDVNRITRREFIKDAAIASAAAAAGSLIPQISASAAPVPDKWDKEADVIVVGYGGAGASAAVIAADAGAKVLLLEKLASPGGNSALSTGSFAAPGTPIQKAAGIDDSPQKMVNYWLKAGMGITDPELTKTIAENALETWQWFTNLAGGGDPAQYWGNLGFTASPFAGPEDMVARSHRTLKSPGGVWEMTVMKDAVGKRSKIEVLLKTPATSLIANANGEVVGVKVQTAEGKEANYKATRAVVLTTGDFSQNDEMAKAFSIETFMAKKNTAPGGTGDGIKMAMQFGAALACMEGTMGGMMVVNGGSLALKDYIFVNAQGMRYVNEGSIHATTEASNYWQAYRTFQQDGHKAFAILDGEGIKNGKSLVASFSDDLADEIKKGWVFKADTVEALAAQMKINPAVLRATIDMWNEDVGKGLDRLFGRTVGNKASPGRGGTMKVIKTAPFYAVLMGLNTIETHGGVRTNGKAQVLTVTGQVIPRLYAAGSTVGGFIGPYYQHSGGGVAQAYTMGRLAGKYAVAEKPAV